MRGVAEYLVFIGLSVGAHVLVLAQPGGDGAGPGGDQGTAQVTLAAAPGDLADLVVAWTTPPQVQAQDVAMPLPAMDRAAPQVQAAPDAQVSRDAPAALAPMEVPQSAPATDQAAPAPMATPQVAALPELPGPVAMPDAPDRPAPGQAPSPATPDLPPVAQDPPPQQQAAAPVSSVRPKARPETTQTAPPPRAAQKAKGQGASPQAGQPRAKAAEPAGPSDSQRRSLMAQWGGGVRASVERSKRYPRGSRDSGRVTLRITLSHTGGLQGVAVAQSSGHAALDRAALAAVRQARFPAAPKGLAAGNHSFNLPVSFAR